MSLFDVLPVTEPDVAFSLIADFAADDSPQKVDLCPGFYRDEQGKPWILPSVQQAKKLLNADTTENHEHLPLSGHPKLISGSRDLVFGSDSGNLSRVATIQTVSGTGSNHLGARILSDTCNPKHVWISNPSWINHTEIWRNIDEDIERRFYPYYAKSTQSLDFQGMIETLRSDAVAGDTVILHGCAHNPTGLDLSKDQWRQIAELCEEKSLFPFFDLAYQGFASGDLANDAWPIRHFLSRNSLEFAVAQSFSKNFGLYGERIGTLHVVTKSEEAKAKVLGKLVQLQRAEITSPPGFGAKLIALVLSDEELLKQWQEDLNHMSGRMKRMRRRLFEELQKRQTPGSWEHMLTEIGMFSMSGLTAAQVAELKEKYHIYLLPSGRISITGLTEDNVIHVAESFDRVIRA